MSTRILIVDDHEVLREGVRSLFAKRRPRWGRAIELTRRLQPSLVVLDITMPRMSGLEASAKLRKVGIDVPILIFTTHHSERLSTEVRQAGAQGYVVKSQAALNLVQAIDTILAGGTFFGSAKPEPDEDKPPKSGILFCRGLVLAT